MKLIMETLPKARDACEYCEGPLVLVVKDSLLGSKTNLEHQCSGRFFRADRGWYHNPTDGSYVATQRLRPLLKMSCPGCCICFDLMTELDECLSEFWPNDFDVCTGLTEITHGKLYQARVTNISTDWESGVVDDWDIEFVRVAESTIKKIA